MEFGMKISFLILLFFAFSANAHRGLKNCRFPAIFNFGDSNSDTGGSAVLYNDILWPNGMTVGKVDKRASDGYLVIDYLAKSLGLPYLNASVDTNGTSFKYGANFAVSGQRANSAHNPMANCWDYPLTEQVSRFLALKSSAISCKEPKCTKIYPKRSAFAKALYTIDIGQNDVASLFGLKSPSDLLDDYTQSVQRLLDSGARYLWIHNTCPYGCLPKALELGCDPRFMPTCTRDKYGCIIEHNQRSQAFNSELKERVDLLRKQYPKAVITLVDMYSAKHTFIANGNGFDDASKSKYCCGNQYAFCGHNGTDNNNQTVFGYPCKDPSKYASWDGVHYSQGGNKIIAKLILDGSFSEPRVALSQACHKPKTKA